VIKKILFSVLADFSINLAAGWFGAVIIVPNFSGINWPYNILILTADVLAGIFSLVIAIELRKFGRY
jgi:hypothetical protein